MQRRVNYLERGRAISALLYQHEKEVQEKGLPTSLTRAADEAIFTLGALLEENQFWEGLAQHTSNSENDAAVIEALTSHLPNLLLRLGAREPPPLKTFVESAKARALKAIHGNSEGTVGAAREGLVELRSRLMGLREMQPGPPQAKNWKDWMLRMERLAHGAATAITLAGVITTSTGPAQPASLPPSPPIVQPAPVQPPLPEPAQLKRMLTTEFIWVSLQPPPDEAP
ncbi:hypothetical protein [Hydrogenophaga sp.]|uniref:hypothetical protein n=1 Tax=Hydrogenophaga sp. TaxID=1904254 RepID=UPI003D1104EA